MLAYRLHSTLFTYVIAANSLDEAERVSAQVNAEGAQWPDPWEPSDVWTRRAVDMAKTPGVIDTIPRFVADRNEGPVYLNIDDVPGKLTPDELIKCRNDSSEHSAWLDALFLGHTYSDAMRNHIGAVAINGCPMSFTLKHYVLQTRALAGAWGLGPVPEWHTAILPALIALDIETTGCVNAFRDDVFELDIVELCHELQRCYSLSEHVPIWCKEALRQTMNCLAGQSTIAEIRATCLDVLTLVDWLR